MCGFVGIASTSTIEQRAWLSLGRDALAHRGPNDAGEWWSLDGRIGVAHRRLSIFDLSIEGHQPMHDSTGSLTIVFNGEIYNFNELRVELENSGVRFRSRSDTEVLIEAYRTWGENCLSHINGMFAFALYDARDQTIFLARDRVGEKPLYYSFENGKLNLASELKALMQDVTFRRKIDSESLGLLSGLGSSP